MSRVGHAGTPMPLEAYPHQRNEKRYPQLFHQVSLSINVEPSLGRSLNL